MIAAHFADYSLPVPTPSAVIVCHGFGCRYRTEVGLGEAEHRKLAEILAAGKASPQAELKAVGLAVAWFDRLVGPAAGTESRVALADFRHYGDPHQFDCVDSSLNTTSVLARRIATTLARIRVDSCRLRLISNLSSPDESTPPDREQNAQNARKCGLAD